MKRAHAARHRHLAAQRKAASSRMDRRIEKESLAKQEAQSRADRFRTNWHYGDMPLRPPAFGPAVFAPIGAARLLGLVR